jgi:hypothetical protein
MLFLQNYEALFSRPAIAPAKSSARMPRKIMSARGRVTAVEADSSISNRWLAAANETQSPRFTVTRPQKRDQ